MNLAMHYERSTKGTHVYKCSEGEQFTAPITVLYIRKNAFTGEPPKAITVAFNPREDS